MEPVEAEGHGRARRPGAVRRLRVGVDARPLVAGRTGVGKYLEGLLRAIARLDTPHEFYLCTDRPLAFEPPGSRWSVRLVRRGVPHLKWLFWLEDGARQVARRERLDVFWGTDFLLPLTLPRRVPTLLTVPDLVPVRWRNTMSLRNKVVLGLLFRKSVQRADRVIALSATAAGEIAGEFGVSTDRIAIAFPGVAARFAARRDRDEISAVARACGIDRPYVLCVGTREPRKNLVTVVRAFARLPERLRRNRQLVIVGAAGWGKSELPQVGAPLVRDRSLLFPGYVPDELLPALYAGAELFAFPSVYEGFGMPVVEAMASGVATVVSDIPVLREIAGDVAAVFVDPLDPAVWARSISDLLEDVERREALIVRGRSRAAEFSFDRSGAIVLEQLETLASKGRVQRHSDILRDGS